MPRLRKHPKIIERKLGREKVWGQHWSDTGLIELDPRQTSRQYLDTLLHELLHEHFPEVSESAVRVTASRITKALWDRGYRRLMK